MTPVQQRLTDHINIWTAAEGEKKSGRGRSAGNDSNGSSVYGVKKLRELILELAVRGKLVPQDLNDEPASELLKRIQAEKDRLIAEGKIKKGKPLPSITDEEKPFELPQGWEWARLNELGIIGSSNRIHQKDWTDSGVPFYRAREIVKLSKYGYVDNELFITEELFNVLVDNGINPEPNDLMITGVGTIGVPYIVKQTDKFYFKDASVLIFKNHFKLFTGYLYQFLISPYWHKKIHSESMGTTVHTLTIARASEIPVPLPPLVEQHRIVAKVDELMALCDQLETQHVNAAEVHEKLISHLLDTLTQSQSAEDFNANWQRIAVHFDTLFTTEASIDALKQTLLQLAVMGKLVPQDPSDEPASELLKRIQAEKDRLIAEGKIKKGKPLPPIADEEKPFELPQGWEWVQMADICFQITDGTHQTPQYVTHGRPFLSAQNVKPFRFLPTDHKFVSHDDFEKLRKNRIPEKGDILLTRVGAMIGEAAVIDVDFEFAFYVSLALLKVYRSYVSPKFIVLWLNSPLGTSMSIKNTLGRGVSAGNLNLSLIRHFLIGFPPVVEQYRIVTKVDELMALCDQLKTRITESGQLQQKLADVVVEQALS